MTISNTRALEIAEALADEMIEGLPTVTESVTLAHEVLDSRRRLLEAAEHMIVQFVSDMYQSLNFGYDPCVVREERTRDRSIRFYSPGAAAPRPSLRVEVRLSLDEAKGGS